MKNPENVNDFVPAVNQGDTQSSKIPTTEQGDSKIAVPEQRMTKTEANPKNARKPPGPTTSRGKRYSSRNARKHGFYAKELLVSEADKPEFEEMRTGLDAQLQPSTVLQRLAFDYVVVCYWRGKLALRLERSQFVRQLQDEQPEKERGEALDVDPVIERWYGCSRPDIRAGIRLLDNAIEEFNGAGYFCEDTKALLKRAFGPDYVSSLEEWNTMSVDAIVMAIHLVRHRKVFGDKRDADVKSPSEPSEPPEVVIDPMQGRHMVVKLLQVRRSFLEDILVLKGQNAPDGQPDAARSSDFSPRFLADANRELRRALDWYLYLRDKGL
jgi:hypothetical protein